MMSGVVLLGQCNILFGEYNSLMSHLQWNWRNYITSKTILMLMAIFTQIFYATLRIAYPYGTRLFTEDYTTI